MARLLDVPRSTVYGILSSKKYAPLLDVIVIAGRRRVTRESFERFLQAQDTYELFNFEYEELELEEKREYVIAEELYIAYHWENSTDGYQYQISGDLL